MATNSAPGTLWSTDKNASIDEWILSSECDPGLTVSLGFYFFSVSK